MDSSAKIKSSINTKPILFNQNNWVAVVVILISTFISYGSLFNNGFVNWDDGGYIYENHLIKEFNLKLFFSEFVMGNYHPLVITTYSIIYHFFDLNPVAYHSVNLLFHLINTCLVFLLFRSLFSSFHLAFIVTLFFGIHPMQVESVAWASALKNVLNGFFFLLSLYQYQFFNKAKNKRKKLHYLLSLLFFLAALLSKATAVSLFGILFLVDLKTEKKFNLKSLIEKTPFFILSLIFGYVAVLAQKDSGAIQELSDFTWMQRLAFSAYTFILYIQKIICPVTLSAFYPYPIDPGENLPLTYYSYPALLSVAAFFLFFKFNQNLFWGVAFFTINIALLLQLLPVGGAMMADRYVYLASPGIFFLIAGGFKYLIDKSSAKIAYASLTVIFLLTGYKTFQQINIWENGLTLWSDMISKSRPVALYYENLSELKTNSQDYTGALKDCNKAIELNPSSALAYNNRGFIYFKLGQYDSAYHDLSLAIQLDSNQQKSQLNMAYVCEKRGDYQAAIKHFTNSIRLSPNKAAEDFHNRGAVLLKLNQTEAGIADIREAILLEPHNYRPFYTLGIAYFNQEKFKESLDNFNHAVSLNRQSSDIYVWRGIARITTKDTLGGIQDFTKAIDIKPDNWMAYLNRGRARLALNRIDEACSDFQISARLGNTSANEWIEQHCR